MAIRNPEDRALYLAWLASLGEQTTNTAVAKRMGLSEEAVRLLRRREPSKLVSATREAMVIYLAELGATGHSIARLPFGGNATGTVRTVRESFPHLRYGLTAPSQSEPVRVWVQEFLLKLIKAGATEDEVDEARILLTRSDVVAYGHGGAPEMGQLSDAERLQLVKAIAQAAIIPRLKAAGRKVSAAFAR